MFQKVEINIPLLDAIKQIPKYAKILKELCVHKRKKMKGWMKLGGIVSTLTRNEEFTAEAQPLPKKCRDLGIFSVLCTIGDYTFADAILDLAASINPLGVLEDVLVQVNELIFPVHFYVLDIEDETSGKGSTLILGRPFLMTARRKIGVHARTLSMEFGDTLVQFNIFEAMKHLIEDHSLFGIDLIDELVEEHFQLDTGGVDISNVAGDTKVFDCLGSMEVHNLSNSKGDIIDLADLSQEAELLKLLDQVCKDEDLECSNNAKVQVVETKKLLSMQNPVPSGSYFNTRKNAESDSNSTRARSNPKAEIMLAQLVPNLNQVDQSNSKLTNDTSLSPPPPIELKPLPNHMKYAYLYVEQQLPVIIANNLHQEEEEKLLDVLRQHKKAIGWKLSNLLGIKPSICMHRILMEKETRPIRQQQRRLNPTILVQVIPKKSGMTVMKNQHDELATRKDHFPLPFIDQVLEKLVGKSHYCFLDGFSGYVQIHIAPKDQHKTTFTYPFSTFAYTRMSFGLCNAPITFQCCMINIFSSLL
ncbi:hypothetical protein CR513_22780, partial [Mucuna pruriens]